MGQWLFEYSWSRAEVYGLVAAIYLYSDLGWPWWAALLLTLAWLVVCDVAQRIIERRK